MEPQEFTNKVPAPTVLKPNIPSPLPKIPLTFALASKVIPSVQAAYFHLVPP